MKKRIKFFFITICFLILVVFVTGCQKDETSKTTFTLADFQAQGKVYESGDPAVELNLGKTKETAAVGLIFKPDGTLYTKDDKEALRSWRDGKISLKEYYTDQTTFYNVTKFWYATVDYVMELPVGATSSGVVYVMDPYREEQIPWNDRVERVYKKMNGISTRTVNPFLNCDVLVGKWTNGNSYGHSCIVYTQSTLGSSATLNQHINATTTFDAWGDMPNTADEVTLKNMSEYWSSSNIQYRYLLKPVVALTSTQKSTIKSYSIAQDPDTYSWSTNLTNENVWYCSKLVWRAYLQIGRDIGQNPSWFVTPMDIADDPDMAGSSFWVV